MSQKISPFLWLDKESEEAIEFYTSSFPDGKLKSIQRYPDGPMKGKVLTGVFEIMGHEFTTINGGPLFKITPAVSFFVNCESEQEVRHLFGKLSEGETAHVLMPLDKYPFSELYGWVMDKFGVSWQITLDRNASQRIVPSLMFIGAQHGRAEEAMKTYTSIFANSRVDKIVRHDENDKGVEAPGTVMHATFTLEGQQFQAMDSGHQHDFTFTEATSLQVLCETQEEVDTLWEKLCAGGSAGQCSWIKDKFGLSWQIVPKALPRLLGDSDPIKAKRVLDAMMKMTKIVIKDLEAAHAGSSSQ